MSQAGLVDIESSHPQIPTEFVANLGVAVPIANVLELLGEVVAAGSNPFRSVASGNIVTYEVQFSQAIASTDATKVGVASFDSAAFTVDANGFVQLVGGGSGIVSVNLQTGTTPITPTAGAITFNGATVAAGTHPVRTDGTGAHTMALEVQISQAIAATDATKIGLSNFDSASFTVDANGFVQLIGGAAAISKINVQTGTTPVVPTAGAITFNGSTVTAGTNPVRTNGTGVSTMAVQVQISQAIASTDATKIGLASFDSARFTVDANGFVSLNSTGAGETITGNSGGALSPTAGNWNILGTGSITTSGSVSTLTIQLTGLTNHAVLVGAGTATITSVGPTSTSGQILQSQGSLADPAFSTATYPSTTTINNILYSSSSNVVGQITAANSAVLVSSSTGVPQFSGTMTNGQVIIGSTGNTPTAATLTAGTGISITNGAGTITIAVNGSTVGETITGNSGGALSPTAGNWNIVGGTTVAGTTPVSTSGSVSTLTINLQRTQAIASTDSTKIGLAAFDSSSFSVDANGFVTLAGGSEAIDSIGVDATSGGGTNPVLPTAAGLVTVNGATVAAGTNPIRTVSTAANVYQIQAQISQAIASTDATKIGLAAFNSNQMSVDANGFVSIKNGGFTWVDVTTATQTLAVQTGYVTDHTNVTYTLPSTAVLGDEIRIVGKLGITTITPNAGQQILIAAASGTVGATGTAVGTNVGDCIDLICTTAGSSTVWRAANLVGNWTLN